MNKLYTHFQIIKKEDAKDIITEILNQYPEGATIDDISEQIHIDQKHLNTIIEEMIKNGTMEIRDGRYLVILPEKMRKNECWDAGIKGNCPVYRRDGKKTNSDAFSVGTMGFSTICININ